MRSAALKPILRKDRAKGGLASWVVNIPGALSDTGRRRQLFFQTKAEAQTACEQLKARKDNFGTSLTALTPARIAESAEAFKLLDPLKISLLDAVRAHIALVKARSKSVTFGGAFDYFAGLKENKSAKYRQEIRQAKATFESLHERMICDINAEDLEQVLDKLPGGSRNAKMRRLRSVFNLAIKRGWMTQGQALSLAWTSRIERRRK
jgi:hypothetical protein